MNLDNALWILEFLAEAALVGVLIYKRAWRVFPIFFVFCAWEAVGEIGAYIVLQRFHGIYSSVYTSFVLYWSFVNTALEFGVLVELAWSILRPIRSSLPKRTPIFLAIIVLLLAAAIWPF